MNMMRLSHSLIAIMTFILIFGLRFAYENRYLKYAGGQIYYSSSGNSDYSYNRKNYASGKILIKGDSGGGNLPASYEKYEKIATLSQTTADFEKDQNTIRDFIGKNEGVIQFESASGLTGSRNLQLGIGIPPQNFDIFIDEVQKVGTLRSISIVKNEKTSEYLKLKAQKAALDKYRDAIVSLRSLEAKVEERLKLEEKYIGIEQEIQDLSVALGDFNTQNELYTVKLSLSELKGRRLRASFEQIKSSLKFSFGCFGLLSLAVICLSFFVSLLLFLIRGRKAG